MIEQFEVHTGPFSDDPYPILDRLREEEPVYRHRATDGWWLTRYDDVRLAVEDETLFLPAGSPAGPGVLTIMHGDEHRRYRALVTPAFAVGALRKALSPWLPAVVEELADAFASASRVDLVEEFANPIPAIVMCRILQVDGFDRDQFMRDAEITLELAAQPGNEQLAAEAPAAARRIRDFILSVVHDEVREPKGGFLTDLFAASLDDGQRLTPSEVAGFCSLLLIAGVETTQRLICNVTYALCRNPDALDALRADPSLLIPAIEETLRFYPPNQFRIRTARSDMELHSVPIREGDRIYALTAAANRDPRAFDNADVFDIRRYENLRGVRPHLAFGWGPHYCLGAFLSKIETELAMTGLLERFPGFRLEPPGAVRFTGFRNRSPQSLRLLLH